MSTLSNQNSYTCKVCSDSTSFYRSSWRLLFIKRTIYLRNRLPQVWEISQKSMYAHYPSMCISLFDRVSQLCSNVTRKMLCVIYLHWDSTRFLYFSGTESSKTPYDVGNDSFHMSRMDVLKPLYIYTYDRNRHPTIMNRI